MSDDDDDFDEIHEHSDWSRNTRQNSDGTPVLHPGFDDTRRFLIKIEKMVQEIEFSTAPPVGFEIKENNFGKSIAVATDFGKRYFNPVNIFLAKYLMPDSPQVLPSKPDTETPALITTQEGDPVTISEEDEESDSDRVAYRMPMGYVYSPNVQALIEAFQSLGGNPYTFQLRRPDWRSPDSGKLRGESFNELIRQVHEKVKSSEHREKMRIRKRNAGDNCKKALEVERKAFELKARWLLLFLNFGYLEQYRNYISLKESQKHLERFLNNRRTNKLLKGIEAYIWKLEEGESTGLHFHVVIFYTADSCHDVYIAKRIGEYWKKVVTKGKGEYWNSNADKEIHRRRGNGIGTGQINWNDLEKREALRRILRYMTKADQYLRLKISPKTRVFGTSEVAERGSAGRPRKKPDLEHDDD